ncbi:histone-fold-containing protein [Phellopilus nigrolimitatus]|nr:histone-fold-containing protein [Phellopilus nigrolimitatus]
MHDAPTTPFVQPGDLLPDFLRGFWQRQVDTAEQETPDFRHPPLPLARIKKVMKSDPDVKMIAADAPILFCKACEIFISEITARAFIVADANKRRTLSRADIAKALSKSDQFDFLIDIVPREDGGFPGVPGAGASPKKTQQQGGRGVGQKRDEDLEQIDLEETDRPMSGDVGLEELQNLLNPPQSRPLERLS